MDFDDVTENYSNTDLLQQDVKQESIDSSPLNANAKLSSSSKLGLGSPPLSKRISRRAMLQQRRNYPQMKLQLLESATDIIGSSKHQISNTKREVRRRASASGGKEGLCESKGESKRDYSSPRGVKSSLRQSGTSGSPKRIGTSKSPKRQTSSRSPKPNGSSRIGRKNSKGQLFVVELNEHGEVEVNERSGDNNCSDKSSKSELSISRAKDKSKTDVQSDTSRQKTQRRTSRGTLGSRHSSLCHSRSMHGKSAKSRHQTDELRRHTSHSHRRSTRSKGAESRRTSRSRSRSQLKDNVEVTNVSNSLEQHFDESQEKSSEITRKAPERTASFSSFFQEKKSDKETVAPESRRGKLLRSISFGIASRALVEDVEPTEIEDLHPSDSEGSQDDIRVFGTDGKTRGVGKAKGKVVSSRKHPPKEVERKLPSRTPSLNSLSLVAGAVGNVPSQTGQGSKKLSKMITTPGRLLKRSLSSRDINYHTFAELSQELSQELF